MPPKGEVVSTKLQASALVVGGLFLGPSAWIGSDRLSGYVLTQVTLLVGFLLLVFAMLVRLWFERGVVNGLALAAAVVWFCGWSWPFTLGSTVWVPYGTFGAAAAVIFATAVAQAMVRRKHPAALSLGVLSGGSLVAAAIAFSDVTFTPQFVFAPLALATFVAGVIGWPWRPERITVEKPR